MLPSLAMDLTARNTVLGHGGLLWARHVFSERYSSCPRADDEAEAW